MRQVRTKEVIRELLDELFARVESDEKTAAIVTALHDLIEKEVGVHSDGGVLFGTDVRPDLQVDTRAVERWIRTCGYKWSSVMKMGSTRRDIRLMRKLVMKGMSRMGWTNLEIATAFKTKPGTIARLIKDGTQDAIFVTTSGTFDSRKIGATGHTGSGGQAPKKKEWRTTVRSEDSGGGGASGAGACGEQGRRRSERPGDADLDR